MTSFSIECATCKAKLRVRDASAIGQIFACPKCGSMVLVQAPAGGLPKEPVGKTTLRTPVVATRSMRDSGEETASATLDELGGEDLGGNNTGKITGHKADNATAAATAEKLFGSVHFVEAADGSSVLDDASGSSRSLSGGGEGVSRNEFVSPQVQLFRRIALIGVATLAAVVVSVLAVGYLGTRSGWASRSNDKNPDRASASTESNAKTLPEIDGRAPRPSEGDAAADASGINQAASQPDASPSSEAMSPLSNPTEAIPRSTTKNATTKNDAGDGADSTQATPNPPVSTEDATPTDPAEKKSDLATPTDGGDPPRDGSAPQSDANKAGEGLAGRSPFGRFRELLSFDNTATPTGGDATGNEAPVKRVAEPEADRDETVPALPRPPVRAIDLEKRLKDPVGSVKYDGVPLIEILNEMSEFSTIPISVDFRALRVQQVSLTAPITIEATGVTFEAVLDKILSPLQLGVGSNGNCLIVGYPRSMLSEATTTRHPIGDLAGDGPEEMEALVQTIKTLVAPESWDMAGGEGAITLEAKNLVIANLPARAAEVVLFCDQLRTVRGQKTVKYKSEQLASRSALGTDNPTLDKPVSGHFVRPTKWTHMLRKIGELTQTTLIVDWPAVSEGGWNPDAVMKFSVEAKPLGETLTAMLEPMGLVYQVVDRDVIEITGSSRQLGTLHLTVYPVGSLLTADRPLESLLDMARMAVDGALLHENGGPGEIMPDPVGNALIVSLPYSQHQLLASMLKKMATEAAAAGSKSEPMPEP